MKRQLFIAIGSGLLVFALAVLIKLWVLSLLPIATFARHIIFELILCLLAIATAIMLFRLPFSVFDLRKRFLKKIAFKYSKRTFLLGIVASASILLLQLPSPPLLKEFNFVEYILGVWIAASFSEEVLCRGMVQGIVKDAFHIRIFRNVTISAPVLASATVFSLIHFNIYINGGHYLTCIIIMFFTFLLGIAAGLAREKSNLGAAVLTHVSFNAGGLLGGIITNIISFVTLGHPINN